MKTILLGFLTTLTKISVASAAVTAGPTVDCTLRAAAFMTQSLQQELLQQSCIYGECSPAGYGFIWYLTKQNPSSSAAPQVVFLTQEFAKQPGAPDSKLVIGFNASEDFFNLARRGGDASILNSEAAQLNSQNVETTIGELQTGLERRMKVGVISKTKVVTYVDAALTCQLR
jgi:hypothetical protein